MQCEVFARVRRGGGGGEERLETTGTTVAALLHPRITTSFSAVFTDHSAAADDVFAAVARPLVASCAEGFNACLLVMGESGSGKTHFLAGPGAPREGLMVQTFQSLFATLDAGRAAYTVALQCVSVACRQHPSRCFLGFVVYLVVIFF